MKKLTNYLPKEFYGSNGHTKNGFTLIELLLYVSIVGAMILTVAAILPLFMQSRVKNQTISEVEQQGTVVMQIITQTVRNAENITGPSTGTTASSVTLDVVTAGLDPTIFDLSGGAIRITEGAGSPVSLTNSRITASDLTFQNLSRTSTPGIIRVQFTLTGVNPEGRQEYNYSRTFYGSASLR